MKKKKIVLLLSSFAVTIGLVGGTLAWLSFHEEKDNQFATTQGLQTQIIENFDKSSANHMIPGVKVEKEVTVKNIAFDPAFLRVKLTPVWKNGQSASQDVLLNLSSDWESNWTKGSDGYYYYNKILNPNESTTELLDSVALNKSIDISKHENQGFTVKVISDALQTTKGAIEDEWNLKDQKIIKMLNGLETSASANQNSKASLNN